MTSRKVFRCIDGMKNRNRNDYRICQENGIKNIFSKSPKEAYVLYLFGNNFIREKNYS
jgi:hypothetical protein